MLVTAVSTTRLQCSCCRLLDLDFSAAKRAFSAARRELTASSAGGRRGAGAGRLWCIWPGVSIQAGRSRPVGGCCSSSRACAREQNVNFADCQPLLTAVGYRRRSAGMSESVTAITKRTCCENSSALARASSASRPTWLRSAPAVVERRSHIPLAFMMAGNFAP